MTYEQLKAVSPAEFKRFTGVQRSTFERMVEALGKQARDKKKRGCPPKLAMADQVLVALQ